MTALLLFDLALGVCLAWLIGEAGRMRNVARRRREAERWAA